MPPELKGELPKGYIWKECSDIRARFPMPETYFFKAENAPGTQGFFLTREPIIGESFIKTQGSVSLKTTDPQGYFKTGLSVNTFFDIPKKIGKKPSAMAEEYISTQTALFPITRVVRTVDGPLHVVRRFFQMGARVVFGIRAEPINFYIECTGNDTTGTFYHVMFETPSAKWKDDTSIARTMIENRILDYTI